MRSSLLAVAAVLVVLFTACGGESGSRVLVLAMDGLDPATIDLLLSEGQLPHFAELRRHGAYAPLRSRKPLLSPVVWTTVATGKTADVHGISHFVAEDPATGDTLPVTREMRRVKALWNILSEHGRELAVVGWWATWPPEPVNGSVVSDHTGYHFLFEEGFAGGVPADAVYPPELIDRIRPLMRSPQSFGAADLARFVDVPATEIDAAFDFKDELSHLRWGLATAESYREIGLALWREDRPDVELVYFEVTDSAAHLFGHLFRNENLAGELAVQGERFGRTVEEVYRLADEILGEYLEVLDDETTLLVLSDHGFELGALHDDPSRTRDLRRVSERFHREHGVLYLYGANVRPGVRLQEPTILDITPTVLALAGVPPAADMPGRVLDEGFRLRQELPRVASYEGQGNGAMAAPAGGVSRDRAAERAALDQLRALGYLDGGDDEPADSERIARPSAAGQRNLAAINFEAGKLEQALDLYRRLVAETPDDAGLRTSLAGTLGALGRYDEALAEIKTALAADPLNIEAYHNRGVIQERHGQPAAAVESYRTALRYEPGYEPSRRALTRLGAPAQPAPRLTGNDQQALVLAERAAEAARRGDYPAAMSHLDAAEAVAPELAVIQQYRSNVAYLMGDVAAAVDALERALELEPDNALFATNLERLRTAG